MKNLTILLLTLCSFTVQAQITAYNNAAQNAFYGIGGYSFTQNTFTAINTNTPISIQLNGNNIRKFGCQVLGIDAAGTFSTSDIVSLTATTNLGATATQTGSVTGQFVGFNVTGNENEYLVSITASFQSTPSPAARIRLYRITVGDNSPQNVALNFDGLDDYVSIPSTVGNFGTNDNFTVSCWVKPDASAIGEQNIINKWSGSGGYAFTIRYYGLDGTILAGQYDGTNFPYVLSTTNLKDGKWHHVAFVKNGSNLLLYIDGIQEGGTSIDNATLSTTNTTPLEIGREATGTKYFKGEIDEVRIWTVAKTATEISDERFCKTPNSTNLHAFYNFNNGVPHSDNILISQTKEAINSANNGTLFGFSKLGDASNFVTGQVKYVKDNGSVIPDANNKGNEGSTWASAISLQSALKSFTCNDLFEVYVARLIYKPAVTNVNVSFNIPMGMRLYGGFAGTEKSINQRNLALIHSTNKTTLSGDLGSNDTPFIFTTNRTDNSINVVSINGSNVAFDGFTVSGATGGAGAIFISSTGTNATINNSRGIDNKFIGFNIQGDNATIANCSMLGNGSIGIFIESSSVTIKESLMANNGLHGIEIDVNGGNRQTTITNCTIASNAITGIRVFQSGGTSTNILKNSLIYGNTSGGIFNSGSVTNTITYSLVQGVSTGTGNLNGNTVNPSFVSPLASGVVSDLGNYRLKDFSPCINVGDDAGVSPLDLDRNPRPKGGKTDMGAYESNINPNEIISIITGNWENTTTWNLERIPLPTDKVIVNGHQVTVTTNTARAKNLEYKTGAILRYLSGGLLRFGL